MRGRLFILLSITAIAAAIITVVGRAVDEPAPVASPFLTGQLLVAAPTMADPRFAHSVIVMVSHDDQGAMGFVINRALGNGPLSVLLETLGVREGSATGTVRLHYGGPVEPNRGFVLHSRDYAGPSTRLVGRSVAVSFGSDVLRAIAGGDGPKRHVFVLGYAGWGPRQLEGEIARRDWLTMPSDEALIFADDLDAVWERAMGRAGIAL